MFKIFVSLVLYIIWGRGEPILPVSPSHITSCLGTSSRYLEQSLKDSGGYKKNSDQPLFCVSECCLIQTSPKVSLDPSLHADVDDRVTNMHKLWI